MNKSSLQDFTPTIGKLNQSHASQLKQSALQFKSTKKRTLRRPLRSKSTVSANSAKNSYAVSINYHNTIDNFSNFDSNNTDSCFKDIGNLDLVFKSNLKEEEQAVNCNKRGVKRSNQQNNSTKKSNYHYYKQLTCHTDRTSKNSQCQQQENSKNVWTDRDICQKVGYKNFKTNILVLSQRLNPLSSLRNSNENQSQPNFILKSQKSQKISLAQQLSNQDLQYTLNQRNNSTYLPKFGNRLSDQSQEVEKNLNTGNKYNFAKKKIFNKILSSDSQQKFKISQFQLGLSISEDIYGKTYPARHKKTGFILCVKQVIKKQVKHQSKKFIQYLKIHSLCNSNYIVDVYGIIEHSDRLYILMEYHNECELYLKLKSQRGISARDSLGYIQNICKGINYLHEREIAYRNLKPQNISFFYDTCKLSNLHSSCLLYHQNSKYMGAIQYCAPELLTGQIGLYQKQCDIWTIGIILYEMMTGTTPWHSLSHKKTINKITSENLDIDLKIDWRIKKILSKILEKDMRSRINIRELLQSIAAVIKQMQKQNK